MVHPVAGRGTPFSVMGRTSMKLLVLLQLVLLRESLCVSGLGNLCSSDEDCSSLYDGEVCGEAGYCVCHDLEALRYDSVHFLKPKCHTGGTYNGSRCGEDQPCPENATCSTNNRCVCRDGYVFFVDDCIPGKPSKVLEPCRRGDDGLMLYCDFNDGLVCTAGQCHCFPEYFLNYTTDQCEPQSDYMEAHNLTKYRVKPGLYCQKDDDCIEGLVCKDFKCACPEECEYKEEEEVCDCGQEASTTGAIILGCILGILVIFFWLRVFQETFWKFKKIKASQTVSEGEDEAVPTYGFSPSNPPSVPANKHVTDQTTSQFNSPSQAQTGGAQPLADPFTTDTQHPNAPLNTDFSHKEG